jgi:hypothetical protein
LLKFRLYGIWPILISLLFSLVQVVPAAQASSYPVPQCQTLFPTSDAPSLAVNWSEFSGQTWRGILNRLNLPKNGVVIEVAPGRSAKIGYGLKLIDFKGTLYVVDPDLADLKILVETYQSLLPGAKIIAVSKTLREAVPFLPKSPDALLSNHPLDDMAMAYGLSERGSAQFFQNINKYMGADQDAVREQWLSLERDKTATANSIRSTVNDWLFAQEELKPKRFVLSQYGSFHHRKNGLSFADQVGKKVLRELQGRQTQSSLSNIPELARAGQDPNDWLVISEKKNLTKEITLRPEILRQIGEKMFVEQRARHVPSDQVEVAYVNTALLESLGFGDLLKDPKKLNDVLINSFALDLQETEAGTQSVDLGAAQVWVDRQADPMGIAMNGNEGSGRAAFVGSVFNIKGIGRTALVNAPVNDAHGDGRIAFSGALWEANAATAIETNLNSGTSEVLAVLRLKNRKFTPPWSNAPITAGLVVRVDRGSLVRPTHAFHELSELDTNDLLKFANGLGSMEAEKFSERIVHGAWSAGNVSLNGNILDMDTLSSVSGYHPQYSLTGWFISNYFGREHEGHLQLLRKMAADLKVNERQIAAAKIEQEFQDARMNRLTELFFSHLGLRANEIAKLMAVHGDDARALTHEFVYLATRLQGGFHSLYTSGGKSSEEGIYRFSEFLRSFSKLRRGPRNSAISKAMLILKIANLNLESGPAAKGISPEAYNALLLEHAVTSTAQLKGVDQRLSHFIGRLMDFSDRLESQDIVVWSEQQNILAFVRNEDRPYLSDSIGQRLIWHIADDFERKKISASDLQFYMDRFASANDRTAARLVDGDLESEIRIFSGGSVSILIDQEGKIRMRYLLLKSHFPGISTMAVESSGKKLDLSLRDSGQQLEFVSDPFADLESIGNAKIRLSIPISWMGQDLAKIQTSYGAVP